MTSAVDAVRLRLERACAALAAAGIPHAVVGGNAIAVWVGMVDQGAIRNTRDVDILLRREDFERAKSALQDAGFTAANVLGAEVFLDSPAARPSDSIHIVFAGEKVQPDYLLAAPDVDEAEQPTTFSVLALPALVRMKLTSFRFKDRVHLQDLIGVGLVDASWLAGLPAPLAERLRELLENPQA
jgi:hypothetical protein